jgi:hypothetical protein
VGAPSAMARLRALGVAGVEPGDDVSDGFRNAVQDRPRSKVTGVALRREPEPRVASAVSCGEVNERRTRFVVVAGVDQADCELAKGLRLALQRGVCETDNRVKRRRVARLIVPVRRFGVRPLFGLSLGGEPLEDFALRFGVTCGR